MIINVICFLLSTIILVLWVLSMMFSDKILMVGIMWTHNLLVIYLSLNSQCGNLFCVLDIIIRS